MELNFISPKKKILSLKRIHHKNTSKIESIWNSQFLFLRQINKREKSEITTKKEEKNWNSQDSNLNC